MPVFAKTLRHAPWVLSGVLLLGLGFGLFTNSGPDDTHITYWPALELLRHGAIQNYNGAPIEQSSSLAHVLLTAGFARLSGLSVTTTGHFLAIAAGVLCLPLVYLLASRVVPRSRAAAPLFVATTAPFVHWTYGGLEAPIFGLSMLLTALASSSYLAAPSWRRWALASVAMVFMAATRPEAILVLACAVAGIVVLAVVRAARRRVPLMRALLPELRLAGALAVASALVLMAHWRIGGHPFPNPVRAKEHGLDLAGGINYLASNIGWRWVWALALFGVGTSVVARRAPRVSRARGATEQMVLLLSLAYLAFIATVGGDWMWGGRMLAHVAPLFGLVVVMGAVRLVPRRFWGYPLGLALVLGNYLPFVAVAQGSRTGRPFWEVPKMRALVHERYPGSSYDWPELASGVSIRDIPVTEELQAILRRIAPLVESGPIVVASRQAGFTIFHALRGEHPPVRFIDLHNLSTDDFLACGGKFLHRETHGALLPFRLLVDPPPELEQACAVVRPHVFFDVPRSSEPGDAERAGYTIVFRQRGKRGGRNWSEGHSAIFIAVDSDLATRAELEPKLLDPLDYDRVTTAAIMRHL
jgi:hypothetical protein